MSPSFEWLWGYTPADLVGKDITEHARETLHPDDFDRMMTQYETAKASNKTVRYEPTRVLAKDGSWKWVRTTGTYYRTAGGKVHYLEVSRDIDDEIQAEQERRDLEAKLQQSQRLEMTLGEGAGKAVFDLLEGILGGGRDEER